MTTQRTLKGGTAIGTAIAWLLASALLAPPTALARGTSVTGKLYPTGVEPHASGQMKASLSMFTGASGGYMANVTVSCKGLTPGQAYAISSTDGYSLWGVANVRGELSVGWTNWDAGRFYSVGVLVEGPLGDVLGAASAFDRGSFGPTGSLFTTPSERAEHPPIIRLQMKR